MPDGSTGGFDPGPWAQSSKSGLNGADPQTLRWPRKEGPRGLGSAGEGPEDAEIPPPQKRRGLVLLLLLFLLDGLTLLHQAETPSCSKQ